MNINIKVNKDFERELTNVEAKYGEDFEILNGFHESQLNFSDFIDGFIDKNVADVTIDGNANAHHKDICSLVGEKGKSEDKLFAFNKIFYEEEYFGRDPGRAGSRGRQRVFRCRRRHGTDPPFKLAH